MARPAGRYAPSKAREAEGQGEVHGRQGRDPHKARGRGRLAEALPMPTQHSAVTSMQPLSPGMPSRHHVLTRWKNPMSRAMYCATTASVVAARALIILQHVS